MTKKIRKINKISNISGRWRRGMCNKGMDATRKGSYFMIKSWHENTFPQIGTSRDESSVDFPSRWASNVELWCFPCCKPDQPVGQTLVLLGNLPGLSALNRSTTYPPAGTKTVSFRGASGPMRFGMFPPAHVGSAHMISSWQSSELHIISGLNRSMVPLSW